MVYGWACCCYAAVGPWQIRPNIVIGWLDQTGRDREYLDFPVSLPLGNCSSTDNRSSSPSATPVNYHPADSSSPCKPSPGAPRYW
ncbi:hypothetical protein L209DRAFT_346607 [Thermothelomyces heterothallicus CBS 203.75]